MLCDSCLVSCRILVRATHIVFFRGSQNADRGLFPFCFQVDELGCRINVHQQGLYELPSFGMPHPHVVPHFQDDGVAASIPNFQEVGLNFEVIDWPSSPPLFSPVWSGLHIFLSIDHEPNRANWPLVRSARRGFIFQRNRRLGLKFSVLHFFLLSGGDRDGLCSPILDLLAIVKKAELAAQQTDDNCVRPFLTASGMNWSTSSFRVDSSSKWVAFPSELWRPSCAFGFWVYSKA